jgi:hypothetical protein
MKKLLLNIVGLLLCITSAFAQGGGIDIEEQNPTSENQPTTQVTVPEKPKIKFGVDAGAAWTVLQNWGDGQSMSGFGYMYGINLNIIDNYSGVCAEVGIGGLVGNYSDDGDNDTKLEIKTHTLNVDLYIGSSSAFYYKAGLRLGFLVDAKQRMEYFIPDFQPIEKEMLNSIQFGLLFELGYTIAKTVNIGLGWHFGFISTFKKEYTDESITPMDMFLKVGVRF